VVSQAGSGCSALRVTVAGGRGDVWRLVAALFALVTVVGCVGQTTSYTYHIRTEGLVEAPTANLTPGPPLEKGVFAAELSGASAIVDMAEKPALTRDGGVGNWWSVSQLTARLAGGLGIGELGLAVNYGNGTLSAQGAPGLDQDTVAGQSLFSATPYMRFAPELSGNADFWITFGAKVGMVQWMRRVVGNIERRWEIPFFEETYSFDTVYTEVVSGSRAAFRPHLALGAGGDVHERVWLGGGVSFETWEAVRGYQIITGVCENDLLNNCGEKALNDAEIYGAEMSASGFFDAAFEFDSIWLVAGVFSTHLLAEDSASFPFGGRISVRLQTPPARRR
jgi:hypothetical protein